MCFWLFSSLLYKSTILPRSISRIIQKTIHKNCLLFRIFFGALSMSLSPLLENVCWRRLMFSCSTSGASLVVCLFNLHAWVVFFNFSLFFLLFFSLSLFQALIEHFYECIHEDVDFLCSCCCICDVNLSSMLLSVCCVQTFFSLFLWVHALIFFHAWWWRNFPNILELLLVFLITISNNHMTSSYYFCKRQSFDDKLIFWCLFSILSRTV